MTRSPSPAWIVIAHDGSPRGYWATIVQEPDEDKAMSIYKDTISHWPSTGGVRLLKPDGTVYRCAGQLGKPGEESA